MSVTNLAKWFGGFLLAIGILGFIPGITADGHLLGIFAVDTLHNIIHIVSGIAGLWAMSSMANSQMFFKVFGVIYALVTIVGIVQGNTVLGLIGVNMADNVLHLLIAAVALYIGFGMKPAMGTPSNPMSSSMS
jgi:hypothetical protein